MRYLSLFSLGLFLLFAVSMLIPALRELPRALDAGYLLGVPEAMGRAGGIGPMLFSTLLINGLALVMTVGLGLPLALFLWERGDRVARHSLQRAVILAIDLLAGTPSIVFGLFGSIFFCRILGLGYSILAGAATLAVMTLPLFARLALDAMQASPAAYRPLARSLGLGRRTTALRILIPSVWQGLVAAVVLSWARATSEAAALLFTAGYATRWPESLLDSGRALPVHIFDLAMNVSGGDAMAQRAALVLLVLTTVFVVVCRKFMQGVAQWQIT